MACAAITVAFAVAGLIAVETDELDILVGLAFLQHIGTGADEFGHWLRLLFSGQDDRRRIVEGEQRGQRRIGLLEGDRHRPCVRRGDIFDEAGCLLAARGDLHPAAKRGDDIFGRHVAAVMELDALPQLDRVGSTISTDLGQAFRQKRRHLPALVEGIECFENMLRDDADEIGGRRHGIKCRRLADRGDIDDAALFLSHHHTRRKQQSGGGKKCKFTSHDQAPSSYMFHYYVICIFITEYLDKSPCQ
ncbi:hypothetical protein D3C78_1219460 [compost metagenome]